MAVGLSHHQGGWGAAAPPVSSVPVAAVLPSRKQQPPPADNEAIGKESAGSPPTAAEKGDAGRREQAAGDRHQTQRTPLRADQVGARGEGARETGDNGHRPRARRRDPRQSEGHGGDHEKTRVTTW